MAQDKVLGLSPSPDTCSRESFHPSNGNYMFVFSAYQLLKALAGNFRCQQKDGTISCFDVSEGERNIACL